MWLLAHGEQEVGAGLDWLAPRERCLLSSLKYTKRRVEFLTRRWTTKRAVATVLGRGHEPSALAGIEIRHHPSGAPWVAVDGQAAAIDVSISDRAGLAVCLVGPPGQQGLLGIDLELVEPRSDAFVGDFFTEREVVAVRRLASGEARDVAANLIWSAKEAALKVLKVGLRADTREVEVEWGGLQRPDGWSALSMTHRDGSAFSGWWRRDGEFVLTIAGRHPAAPPSWMSGSATLATAVPVHSWLAQPLVPAADANSGQAWPQDGLR